MEHGRGRAPSSHDANALQLYHICQSLRDPMRSANSGRLGSLVVYARRNNYNKKPARPRNSPQDISESTDFRKSKTSLSKSKEKVSAEEEKLLSKEEEAKVVTRVDMADARYVVEDHKNGDANIELDANKRQFTGLTKEELMKYAEDPFWVRLRWFMFILFWSLWLCMLAAAIAIIVRAPKCAPPPPKTWYEKGPLVDMSSVESFEELETELPLLKSNQVQGIFTYVCKDTYEVLEEPTCLQKFKDFVTKAKDYGIKVIVDLTANSVGTNHSWFTLSENRTAGYEQYFLWADGAGFGEDHKPNPPNNWQPERGAMSLGATHSQHAYWQHRHSRDLPTLLPLLQHWAHLVDHAQPNTGLGETVFTLWESVRPELFLVRANVSGVLRPASAAPLNTARPADLAAALSIRLPHWPAIQLEEDEESEVWMMSALLPAAPVLARTQLLANNDTDMVSWERVWALRSDASVEHGRYSVSAVPDQDGQNTFIACARWKAGHTGYVALYNAGETARANLTAPAPALSALPARLAVHHVSHTSALLTNYTVNMEVETSSVLVPAKSALLLSFVPNAAVEE
ncbi:4F2 cell-surface antigen heavy chain [Papilio machaon]|uniref:alpha-glucosidase n=1 Tax=Papilio machaon TaxID=76193 RepID=A0A0N1PG78_PAPMA|nr:4F2 cell-surface antigen heavy chain [Papilio machaon]